MYLRCWGTPERKGNPGREMIITRREREKERKRKREREREKERKRKREREREREREKERVDTVSLTAAVIVCFRVNCCER